MSLSRPALTRRLPWTAGANCGGAWHSYYMWDAKSIIKVERLNA